MFILILGEFVINDSLDTLASPAPSGYIKECS